VFRLSNVNVRAFHEADALMRDELKTFHATFVRTKSNAPHQSGARGQSAERTILPSSPSISPISLAVPLRSLNEPLRRAYVCRLRHHRTFQLDRLNAEIALSNFARSAFNCSSTAPRSAIRLNVTCQVSSDQSCPKSFVFGQRGR